MASKLQLLQVTAANGLWAKVRAAWEKQYKEHHTPSEYPTTFLDHAEKICKEDGLDPKYGVYLVSGERNGVAAPPYEGLVHVNFKFPGTKNGEIRLVWARVAPRYQFVEEPYRIAEIQAAFINGALHLAERHNSPVVKMFLNSPADHAFGRNFALFASNLPDMKFTASVRGSWLHIDKGGHGKRR
ncbi:MAG TPA: hypothetical protein VGO34_15015 [Alphaproteobacteria bacterium]|jgi:hypothetical protein